MIRDILLNTRNRRQLYKNKLVCGCMYRSFTDLQAGIFFRFTINNGRLTKQQIKQLIPIDKQDNFQKFIQIIRIFKRLQIVRTNDDINYQLFPQFIKNVEQFIKQQKVLQPIQLQNKPISQQPQPFQFIQILFDNKLPKRCKINGVNSNILTKQQFIYIKSDISYKISILIDGIINGRQNQNLKNIQALILLNLLDSQQYYLRNQKLNPLIQQLSRIRLVQKAGKNNQYFRISKYLQHFTFKSAKQRHINTKLNCRIIIQTNFKVFAQIKSNNLRQIKVIKNILSMLLRTQREGVQCQQFFIGQINQQFMKKQIFRKMGITTVQYFDFFKQYTDQKHLLHKDLGKWRKIKFIGLQGPSQQSNIPSNIRQQVKLWQHLKDDYQN